jgi:hypothetical protein
VTSTLAAGDNRAGEFFDVIPTTVRTGARGENAPREDLAYPRGWTRSTAGAIRRRGASCADGGGGEISLPEVPIAALASLLLVAWRRALLPVFVLTALAAHRHPAHCGT